MNEIGPDKAGASGDQQFGHFPVSPITAWWAMHDPRRQGKYSASRKGVALASFPDTCAFQLA
jgi:hypothetical protein